MVTITIDLKPDWRLIIEEPSEWHLVSTHYCAFSFYLEHKSIRCLVQAHGKHNREVTSDMQRVLGLALKGDLILHFSIKSKIGLLWEEDFQCNEHPDLVMKEGTNTWVGNKHFLWATTRPQDPCSAGWLYVEEGQLFLEVTPTYPYLRSEPEKGDWVPYTYEEFVANYQTLVKIPISWHAARRWYHQIDELEKTMLENWRRITYEESLLALW